MKSHFFVIPAGAPSSLKPMAIEPFSCWSPLLLGDFMPPPSPVYGQHVSWPLNQEKNRNPNCLIHLLNLSIYKVHGLASIFVFDHQIPKLTSKIIV
ncbi:hypothetical protein SLA2020_464760 [Shorea laevis]